MCNLWNKQTVSMNYFFLVLILSSFLQEEELRGSTDPKYQHLQEDLHVEITAFAPPGDIF